jgi:alkylation response protein AidB-like acyl-CoA dehydrogenase
MTMWSALRIRYETPACAVSARVYSFVLLLLGCVALVFMRRGGLEAWWCAATVAVCVARFAAPRHAFVLCSRAGQCALLKVQASKTFEYCAREASQIFGGNSIVKEGRGKLVERMYREVRGAAIPGGSEEILLDFAMRQAVAKARKLESKL